MPSTSSVQPLHFFISHWWGEYVRNFINYLEQAVQYFVTNKWDSKDIQCGEMIEDTPIWVCTYAKNQWHLGDDDGLSERLHVHKGLTTNSR